jgi:hydrogenase maturation factor
MIEDAESPETGVATLGALAADLASAALALARRFAAGATLWCWAPGAPQHASHVAVEFVHPVIMGKRALPAVALATGDDGALDALRSLVAPGDVVMVLSAVCDARVDAVLRRASSWGVSTIWIGAGERPAAGAADHVLWSNGDPGRAMHDGQVVLLYHLLWELTHVCFEHGGLLQEMSGCTGDTCITCSDGADIAEVVDADAGRATVRAAGRLRTIDTTLIDGVGAGDLVLVHAGTAISIVDESR